MFGLVFLRAATETTRSSPAICSSVGVMVGSAYQSEGRMDALMAMVISSVPVPFAHRVQFVARLFPNEGNPLGPVQVERDPQP